MDVLGQVARAATDVVSRSVALGTELSSLALRGMASSLPPELIDQVRRAIAEPLQALLEVPGTIQQTTGMPVPQQAIDTANVVRTLVAPEVQELTDAELVQRRFDELIQRSIDVHDDAGMPAFVDVVAQLTPDEARIIRAMADRGPVPTIDLDAVSLVGRGTRSLLAHQTMVAEHAGCVAEDRVDTYLANLARLGIVEFTGAEIDGHDDYQLITGTRRYRTAAKRYRDDRLWRTRARLGRMQFTPFGTAFVEACLGRSPAAEPANGRATAARAAAPPPPPSPPEG